MDNLADMFSALQGLLFEQVLQPVMFATGLGHLLPDGFNAMGCLLVCSGSQYFLPWSHCSARCLANGAWRAWPPGTSTPFGRG